MTAPCRIELSAAHQARSLGACRLYLQITIVSCCAPVLDPDRCKDSGEMYSPDNQGEYTSLDEAPRFSLQGLSDALADIREGTGETSVEEYAMMLEVMMADRPGRPCPPAFSWNAGMVMHVLKSDLVLQQLEHVQVDGPGTAYLFFYDKQGHRGLEQDAADAVWTHVEEAFSEWISCSTHFTISLLPLMEAWQQSVAASDCQRLRSQAENPVHNMPVGVAQESDSSSQLGEVHLSRPGEPLGWER